MSELENVVVIGSGPAAHTAAIYLARAMLHPLMFEGFMAGGIAAGGQLTTTDSIENFPGFSEGISGIELMYKMREQSIKSGVRIVTETVEKVDLGSFPFKSYTASSVVESKSLIIATGALAKRLSLPNEARLWQKGISACAVCDGGLPMYRNQELAVVGGGDTAVEEATYLTKFASKVYLIHRRDQLRASQVMRERVLSNPKIEMLWNTVVDDVEGVTLLESLVLKNVITHKTSQLKVKGLFYAIGHRPNTEFLNGQLSLDEAGYVITSEPFGTKTNVQGVFVAGDVKDKRYRQAIVAAGSGCMAALDAEEYLLHP